MSILKTTKDQLIKMLYGKGSVPAGLLELDKYFRIYKSISFEYINEGNKIIAKSENFKQGSIITSGKNRDELNRNIEDAILTAFDVPSSYAENINLHPTGSKQEQYAIA